MYFRCVLYTKVSSGRPSASGVAGILEELSYTWLQLAHSSCFCVELIPCKNANAIPLHWCLIDIKIKNQMPLNALLLSSKVRWVDVHWQAVESQFILLKAEYGGRNIPLCASIESDWEFCSSLKAALTASLKASLDINFRDLLERGNCWYHRTNTSKYIKLSSYSLEKIGQVSKQVKNKYYELCVNHSE